MADIRVNALPTLGEVAAEDILHILDASTTDDVDSQTTVDAVADWIIANKSVRITGIDDVPGLRAALDGKADIVHTHTVAQVIGLQSDLDAKTDVTQAQIIGRNIVLNGKSINVPSTIGGLQDDRIPDTVLVGDYLQFGTTTGGINNITGDTLKGNLALNLVDNTTDISKPVSTAQQSALDLKVDTTTYTTGQATQDTNITANATDIATNVSVIALNTAKVSFDSASSTKLDGIEAGADVTDTGNVWGSLGISGSGSTNQVLTQRGVFVDNSVEVTKSAVDNAIGSGTEATDYYASDKTWKTIPTGGGGEVTKAAVDTAIGVFSTGDSAQFYNEQGNFIDAVYDSIENAPIIRNRTIESIVLSGTRSNVQARLTGVSELSTITMQNTFDSSPTQYTTTLASPNTTLSPVISLPAGSQGRQLSLTEADGTVHRFCYLVNGNYRLLAGGLTGTVRLGPVAVATTATVTAAVTVPDQTAGQTITLVGDETGTFAVGDFISPQANNFGAYRGIFIDSITFNGTNTVIVGPSNGATTFNTTSVLRNAGPATEIQGTIPTFSGDPDTANTVYSSSIPATEFTVVGVNTSAHLIQVANAFAALETAITTDGIVTDNGDGTSSITVNYNTETNIDSSFTITGGLNNMESIVNVDGAQGELSPATTITVTDPEATEVVSFTSSAATTATNNVDDIAAQIVTAVNNNVETPINFDAEYDAATNTIVLTAERAGNTNPWTIVFDNNGVTNENAGDLGYTSSQTGELVNELPTSRITGIDGSPVIAISSSGDSMSFANTTTAFIADASFAVFHSESPQDLSYVSSSTQGNIFNFSGLDKDFRINKQTSGDAFRYDAGTDTLSTEAVNVVGFGGGADGLSITDTVNLNLLEGTTVLSTVVLPSSSGTTVIAGTANEIVNTVSGDTNTLSLAPAITDAITANTAKTGITTAQAAAITSNTGKTGITVEQSNAIIANTSKTGITTAQATAITTNTGKTGITTAQANAITANTAKTGISTVQATAITNNTAKVGITTAQATAITDNTAKTGITTAQASAITANTSKVGITTAQASAITANTAKTGISTAQASAITANTAKNSYPTADSTKLAGIETAADVTDTANVVGSLTAGTNITIAADGTISAASGGTATTVLGTANEIDVNTVGTNATVSISSTVTDAIDLNTAKQSVAGLNQVGAAVLSTDSVLYYAGTALAPRRKTFSLVPLSIMNNDAGFTTNTGTVTSVTGTANEVDVATGTTTPVVSLNNTITSAITANTNKTGITTAQSSAITANTAKVGITTAQSDAITANTAKQSVAGLTQVGGAIIASDSVLYYDGTVPRRKVFSNVPLSIFNNDAGFVTTAGDVFLANDQTFTGLNVFSNAGGIQTNRVTGIGDTDTYIDVSGLADDSMFFYTGGNINIGINATGNTFNALALDMDFRVRKQTSGNALLFDAGTDTLSTDAANLVGFAGSETGTWTPVFNRGGTQGTVNASYSKSGQTVTCYCEATIAASTNVSDFTMNTSSLPFTNNNSSVIAVGTYYSGLTSVIGFGTADSGVVAASPTVLFFLDVINSEPLDGNDLRGYIGFTITYQTDD